MGAFQRRRWKEGVGRLMEGRDYSLEESERLIGKGLWIWEEGVVGGGKSPKKLMYGSIFWVRVIKAVECSVLWCMCKKKLGK